MLTIYGFAVIVASILGTAFVLLHLWIHWTQEDDEPPVLGNSIPFISPILGLLRKRTNYMVYLRNKNTQLGLYTLRLPASRIYVVNSPSFIPLVQRQRRIIAFEPIPANAAANIMGVSQEGIDVIGHEPTNDNSYFRSFLRATHPTLSPGVSLAAINRASIDFLATSLRGLERRPIRVNLYEWVRHEIMMATTEATYGPGNPFRDPSAESNWYEFDQGIMLQMMQVYQLLPRGRSSFRARESLVSAFERYFSEGHHLDPSQPNLCLVQTRYNHNSAQGLSPTDKARTEIGQVAASVSNTIPAAFWMLWHVIKDPVVFSECRSEIERLVCVEKTEQQNPDGTVSWKETWTIDLNQLTDNTICPILVSTWHEVLRYNHVGIAARVVMEDTRVDKYFLRKGSTLMIVNSVMHSDKSVWGPSADEFDHRRFLPQSSPGRNFDLEKQGFQNTPGINNKWMTNPEKSPACRIFGGGSTLCPGRHFASQEVLSFLALTIMRFDVRPVKGSFAELKKDIPLPTSLPIPEAIRPGDLEFDLVPRYPEQEWSVEFSRA